MDKDRIKMVFKCQADSFLKEFETEVVKVEKSSEDAKFAVEFQDTILFPEGGGQPADHGTIVKSENGNETIFEVKNVIRKGFY